MKSFLNVLAKIAAAAAVVAAVAAVLYRLKKDRDREDEELDQYLMGDPDSESPVQTFYVKEDLDDMLSEDAQEWESLPEGEKVVVSFLVEPDESRAFQDSLADLGVSSAYDEDNRIMDIYISGPMDKDELKEVASELQKAAKSNGVSYQGFAFE